MEKEVKKADHIREIEREKRKEEKGRKSKGK